jgi:cleavage and polyadenylation specificity factor subunit 3
VEAVLDMALATISSLAESYTSGVSLGTTQSFVDGKEEEADVRMEDDSYLPRGENRTKRGPLDSRPKEEASEDEEGSEDSDEILEVIG